MKGEVMFLFGIGYKCMVHLKLTKQKVYSSLWWVNLLFKSLTSIIGYGSVLSQFTLQCLRIYMSKDRNMIVVEQFIT